jgi:translation initiation factor 2 alpha subunit (eIF-2alpha)
MPRNVETFGALIKVKEYDREEDIVHWREASANSGMLYGVR